MHKTTLTLNVALLLLTTAPVQAGYPHCGGDTVEDCRCALYTPMWSKVDSDGQQACDDMLAAEAEPRQEQERGRPDSLELWASRRTLANPTAPAPKARSRAASSMSNAMPWRAGASLH